MNERDPITAYCLLLTDANVRTLGTCGFRAVHDQESRTPGMGNPFLHAPCMPPFNQIK
jgi:hypothetical protein